MNNTENNKVLKGFLLAVSAAILWGVSGTFGQFLFQQRGVNVEWLITIRMLVTGAVLLILAGANNRRDLWSIWSNRKDAIDLLLFSIVGVLAVQYSYFAAINYSNAATATVMQYTGPVMIAIYIALKERKFPNGKTCLAILLAVLGTFLLVTHGKIGTLSISGIALFFGLVSAVTLAFYTLQPVHLLNKYKSTVVIGWGMLIGGIAFCFVRAPWDVAGVWDIQTYSYTSFIVIFGTLIPFYAYLTAVKLIGGQKTSLLASAEPLSAALLAVLWLNTPFAFTDWMGTACIILTIVLLGTSKKEEMHTV
ncbi:MULTISPECIES: DMT family transporter [Sphingobacterium]|uniref:Threonine/homoserine efflux transporter RhtA n=2 Tax=Sphingobacterium TaxID=28453 RepID=A0A420BHR8_SPHD1|nr:DMT family transporter [Sphingobacterium detergens]RKE56217.1 threonine/homoserine efflux transporter RhtA [Sphingobacterium detergens]